MKRAKSDSWRAEDDNSLPTDDDAHSWTCTVGDHAETPLRAYQHVVPILEGIAKSLKKSK